MLLRKTPQIGHCGLLNDFFVGFSVTVGFSSLVSVGKLLSSMTVSMLLNSSKSSGRYGKSFFNIRNSELRAILLIWK